MKASINLDILRSALVRVAHVPGAKGNIPESQLVKLAADFEGLQLTRVTPESVAIARCEADIHDEGEILLDFSQLQAFVQKVAIGPVFLEQGPKAIEVKAGRSRVAFDLITTAVEEHAPEHDMEFIELTAGTLGEWIKRTENAMAEPSLVKPFIEGMVLQTFEDEVRAIGTDGRRIHCIKTGLETTLNHLIPREVVACIKSIVSAEDIKATVILGIGDRQILFRSPGVEIRSALFDVKVPQIAQFLTDEKVEAEVAVSPEEMLDGLRAATPFGHDATRVVSLELLPTTFTLIANNEKGADFRHEIDIKGRPNFTLDNSAKFRCSAAYLIDAFQTLTHKDIVTFRIADGGRSAYLFEDDLTLLLMGMHEQAVKNSHK